MIRNPSTLLRLKFSSINYTQIAVALAFLFLANVGSSQETILVPQYYGSKDKVLIKSTSFSVSEGESTKDLFEANHPIHQNYFVQDSTTTTIRFETKLGPNHYYLNGVRVDKYQIDIVLREYKQMHKDFKSATIRSSLGRTITGLSGGAVGIGLLSLTNKDQNESRAGAKYFSISGAGLAVGILLFWYNNKKMHSITSKYNTQKANDVKLKMSQNSLGLSLNF